MLGQDLPRLGAGAEPGGEVGDTADRGVVETALEADPAERRVTLRDPDAEAEVVTEPIGELALRGFSKPVRAFDVRGLDAARVTP